MSELTPEQRQALRDGVNRVRDPETNEIYVLIREDFYERLRKVVDGFTRSTGWDDPELDVYERYRKQA
jgi:hypothetical protein